MVIHMTKDEYERKQAAGELQFNKCEEYETTVNPHDIITEGEWNADHPNFWNHHGNTKEGYLDYVGSGKADNAEAPDVYKCGDKYVLVDDGNHRVAASQELNRPMKVNVKGEYTENGQAQFNNSAKTSAYDSPQSGASAFNSSAKGQSAQAPSPGSSQSRSAGFWR